MQTRHLERLQPICPVCRVMRGTFCVLRLGHVARSEGDDILEGALVCPTPECQREHPIVDGIPVLVVDPVSWASSQLDNVLRRDDLSPYIESLLGDLAGLGSGFDRDRGRNSIYGDAHWGDGHPALLGLFETAMKLLERPPAGVWIDIGCSVGRGAMELAALSNDLTVGLDLSFSMLRIAERIRRTGHVRYSRRRVGLVFDPVEEVIAGLPGANISYWCADAAILPFQPETFAGALALNILDCSAAPLNMLSEMGRVLRPQAAAILSTPFDWEVAASPPAAWIGGHSQRGPHGGSSLSELRRILTPGGAGIDTGLTIEAELDQVPWRVRNHDRSVTEYEVFLARLRRN